MERDGDDWRETLRFWLQSRISNLPAPSPRSEIKSTPGPWICLPLYSLLPPPRPKPVVVVAAFFNFLYNFRGTEIKSLIS